MKKYQVARLGISSHDLVQKLSILAIDDLLCHQKAYIVRNLIDATFFSPFF